MALITRTDRPTEDSADCTNRQTDRRSGRLLGRRTHRRNGRYVGRRTRMQNWQDVGRVTHTRNSQYDGARTDRQNGRSVSRRMHRRSGLYIGRLKNIFDQCSAIEHQRICKDTNHDLNLSSFRESYLDRLTGQLIDALAG